MPDTRMMMYSSFGGLLVVPCIVRFRAYHGWIEPSIGGTTNGGYSRAEFANGSYETSRLLLQMLSLLRDGSSANYLPKWILSLYHRASHSTPQDCQDT